VLGAADNVCVRQGPIRIADALAQLSDALPVRGPLLRIEAPGPNCFSHRFDCCRNDGTVVAKHDDVRPGLERLDRAFLWSVPFRDCAHAEIIGKNDAFEMQLLAKNIAEHSRRKRRRAIWIELREQDVSRHYGRHIRGDGSRKGDEFVAGQTLGGAIKARQVEMRIDCGVAVPRKMLRTAENTLGREAAKDRDAHLSDFKRIGTEAAA
jgi:hypothetical protein